MRAPGVARLTLICCGAIAHSAVVAAELEEVIVTARRVPESLQRVSIAVTALSADDVRNSSITSMQDLSILVPSLAINNEASLGPAFVLRGQGTILGAPPGVIVYFAEVPAINSQTGLGLAQGGLMTGQLFDLASVEVLKGPQGTLFGRNTTGGAILITPAKPTGDLEGYAQLTVGDYRWREFEGALNVSLAENKLLLRLAYDVASRDGYTLDIGPFFSGRDYDDRQYQAARLSAVWRPTDAFENYLIASIYDRDQHGPGGVLDAVDPDGLGAAAFPAITQYLAEQELRGARRTSLSGRQFDRQQQYGVFDIVRWDLTQRLQLRNITAYQRDKNTVGIVDSDFTTFALQEASIPEKWAGAGEKFTEELQLSGHSSGEDITWVLGGYYEYERPTATSDFDVAAPAQVGPGQYVPTLIVVRGGTTQRSRALYGQATYGLGVLSRSLERMKLTAGLRYTWDDAVQSSSIYIPTFGNVCAFTSGTAPGCVLSPSGAWSAPTWTVALEAQATPKVFAYVTSRRGYKSGGFNLTTPLHAERSTYGPERVTDVELGVKADWQHGGVSARTNVAAFYADYAGVQRTIPVVINDISAPLTENAARATIAGIELEQIVVVTKHSEVSLSYSYLDSKYKEFFSPVTGDMSGQPFPYTPRNKVSISGLYHSPLPSGLGDITARVTYSYQSSVSGQVGGGPLDAIDGYGLLNLRVSCDHILGSRLDASLFVTNATNEIYVTKLSETYRSYGVNGVVYGEPRMVGAQVRYTF